jgi:chemotaxis protein CheD
MKDERIVVGVGDLRIARGRGTLATVGLGSCVAIILYHRRLRIGGLAHAMLPHPENGRPGGGPARFASTAVPELIRLLADRGADARQLEARLVGGASMFQSLASESGRTLGSRNVAAALDALSEAGIEVRGRDLGGTAGRSVFFDVATGTVRVSTIRGNHVQI